MIDPDEVRRDIAKAVSALQKVFNETDCVDDIEIRLGPRAWNLIKWCATQGEGTDVITMRGVRFKCL